MLQEDGSLAFQCSSRTDPSGVLEIDNGVSFLRGDEFSDTPHRVSLWPSTVKYGVRRYTINKAVFLCVSSHFEEIFGFSLDCDLLGDVNTSLLPTHGVSRLSSCKAPLVFGDPSIKSSNDHISFFQNSRTTNRPRLGNTSLAPSTRRSSHSPFCVSDRFYQ